MIEEGQGKDEEMFPDPDTNLFPALLQQESEDTRRALQHRALQHRDHDAMERAATTKTWQRATVLLSILNL